MPNFIICSRCPETPIETDEAVGNFVKFKCPYCKEIGESKVYRLGA